MRLIAEDYFIILRLRFIVAVVRWFATTVNNFLVLVPC